MKASRQRIGLFGLFGCGNFGNDGSLEAMLIFLRRIRPGAELTCICGEPDRVRDGYRIATLPISSPSPSGPAARLLDRLLLGVPHRLASWLRAVRHARGLDVLIVPGTGILDDFGTGPFGMPVALFGWCLAARLSGTRIGFVSIGAGPIRHGLSRWLMRSAVRGAHYRSYRDTISRDFVTSIGCDSRNDPVYPDLAFRLPAPLDRGPRAARGGPLTVGVGVMAYYGWRNDTRRGSAICNAYLDKVAEFVGWLLQRGHRVRLLTGDLVDQHAVDQLLRRMIAGEGIPLVGQLVTEPACSLHDLMAHIADTDVVVATRFHNIVCALKLDKPTISLSYARKNDVLMADMGLGEFCQHVESLDVGLLIEQFTNLVSRRAHHERIMQDVNSGYRSRLDEQEALLASMLL